MMGMRSCLSVSSSSHSVAACLSLSRRPPDRLIGQVADGCRLSAIVALCPRTLRLRLPFCCRCLCARVVSYFFGWERYLISIALSSFAYAVFSFLPSHICRRSFLFISFDFTPYFTRSRPRPRPRHHSHRHLPLCTSLRHPPPRTTTSRLSSFITSATTTRHCNCIRPYDLNRAACYPLPS